MAKTNWQMNEVVQPADLNQIGQEINELQEAVENIDIPDATLTTKGMVKLSSATDSTAEDRAATPKAVKDAMDAAAGATGSISTHANATNVHGATTAATASRLIIRDAAGRAKVAAPAASDDIARLDSITKAQAGLSNVDNYGTATKVEAETGTAANKFMTPQRVKQYVDMRLKNSLELRLNGGLVEFWNGSGWLTLSSLGTKLLLPKPSGSISIPPAQSTYLTVWSYAGRGRLRNLSVLCGSNAGSFPIDIQCYIDGQLVAQVGPATNGSTSWLTATGFMLSSSQWGSNWPDDRYVLDIPFTHIEVKAKMNNPAGTTFTTVTATALMEVAG
jgi:hypothetical protein